MRETILKKDIFNLAELPQFFFWITEKIFLSFKNKEILLFKVTKGFFRISRRSHLGDPQGTALETIFYGKDILRKNTSAIGNIKNSSS